jgi:hypothetical protein
MKVVGYFFFWGGGESVTPCVFPPPQPPFPIIIFLSTTLLTGMAGISLHRAMASDFSVSGGMKSYCKGVPDRFQSKNYKM